MIECILYFCIDIMIENKTKSSEYSQLLNCVKSGLIMIKKGAEGNKIKFANLMAIKIFIKLPRQEDRLTEADMKKRIFKKVTFED